MSGQRRTTSYRNNSRRSSSSYGNSYTVRRTREEYMYGNAAPDYEDDLRYEERREREESRRLEQERRNEQLRREEEEEAIAEREKERATAATRVQVAAAALLLGLLTVSIIGYVELMSRVSVSENHISSLETKIENLRTQNDQTLEEINSSVNLEEIKEIAINELGMKYADSSQIVTYSSGTDEYVHQVQEAGD